MEATRCGRCKEFLTSKETECPCGWKRTDLSKKTMVEHRCTHREGKSICGKAAFIGCPSANGTHHFACQEHYWDWFVPTDLDKMRAARLQTHRAILQERFGKEGMKKRSLREILNAVHLSPEMLDARKFRDV